MYIFNYREFIYYIRNMAECSETTIKQIRNTFESEMSRQNSFIYQNWPKNAPVWPILLARAGFYYQGKDLEIVCFSCGLRTTVADWTRNVHPQQMHFKLNPDCEFILKLLEPQGGSKTFNDRGKWELSSQKENKSEIKQDSETDEGISDRRENVVQENIPESVSVIDSSRTQSETAVRENIQGGETLIDSSNTFVPYTTGNFHSTIISQDSGFHTTDAPSIACDSGPSAAITRDNLLVSGSYATRPFLFEGYLQSSIQVPSTELSDETVNTGLQLPRPEDIVYKHPEMETVAARLESFETWPHRDILSPRVLVTAGFFFTLDGDIVRCFCCDLGLSEWQSVDDAWIEHARHSPNCWYLKRVKGQHFIDEIQKEWKKIYNPKFPNLIDEVVRIRTFNNFPDWISTPSRADIAKAGFFYSGRGDECRCHYCDGGLQHWEEGDDPWEQHAYYFPYCKFMIKMRGRDFINEVRSRFDAREIETLISANEELEIARSRVDVRDRKINELLSKEEFKDIYNLGYSKKTIKMAAAEVFKQKGDFNFTPEHILNMILDLQDKGDQLPGDEDDADEENTSADEPVLSPDEFVKTLNQPEPVGEASKLLEENKKLKESMICWKCGQKEICILFTPCGHRLMCDDCAKPMHHCMKCNRKIKKKHKTYLA